MISLIGESVSDNEDKLFTFNRICWYSSLVESLVLTIAFTQISKAKGLVFKISEDGIITGMMRRISEQIGAVSSNQDDEDKEYETNLERTRSHINRKIQLHVHHNFISTDLDEPRLPTEYWG